MTTRPSSRLALGYLATPGAAAADYSWRLYVVAYSMPPAGLLYLLLPHDEPTYWGWIAVSAAFLAVAVAIGLVEMLHTTHSDCGNNTTPRMTVLLTEAVLGSILAVDLGVTPWTGSLRWFLLVPTLVVITFANTPMFAVMAASSLGAMSAILVTTGVPVAQLVTELVAAVVFVTIFRIFAVRTVAEFARDLMFGSMSEVAATVDALEEGWAQMLPLVCAYLAADRIVVLEVTGDGDDGRGSDLREVVCWPDGRQGPPEVSASRELARQALATGERVHVPTGIGIPVAVTQGRLLVAVVAGAPHRFILDMYQETRANHVAQQLGVLVNRIRSIEGLERLTRTDSLTGLPNRRELVDRLRTATDPDRPSASPLCAAMVDLDFFKAYNDDFGHQAGDRALEAFARLLSSGLRTADVAFRYGGEEFAVLMPGTDAATALTLLDELRGRVADLRLHRPLTISVGIACWIEGEAPEALVSRADQALYLAKAEGRDRCCVWSADVARPTLA